MFSSCLKRISCAVQRKEKLPGKELSVSPQILLIQLFVFSEHSSLKIEYILHYLLEILICLNL